MNSRATVARRRTTDRPRKAAPSTRWQWVERLPVWTAQIAVLVLLVASPWAFGGVRAEFQAWCFAPIMLGLLCWAVALPLERKKSKPVLPLALAPLLLALFLGGMQLLPVGRAVGDFVSPQATEWRELLSAGGQTPTEMPPTSRSVSAPAKLQPLSIYPAATQRQLALLTLAICAFALGAQFFRRRGAQLVLCLVAAVNGAAIAMLGIAQRISGHYDYLGRAPTDNGSFASFFNENNAAGYLSMCLACSLPVLSWLLARNRPASDIVFAHGIPLVRPTLAARLADVASTVCRAIGSLKASTLGLFLVLGVLLAGVLCSLSRGTWLALAVAVPITVFATRQKKGLASTYWSLAIGGIVSAGLIAWVGVSRLIERRGATLLEIRGLLGDARLGNWAESLRALGDYWIAGSGLGTYGYAYLPYQQHYNNAWHLHAENQYLEALIDGGVIGLALMLCAMALVLLALRKILSDRSETASAGLVAGGILLVVTQSLHAVVDFGLYLPANFLLMATFCGSICGRAARLAKNDRVGSRFSWVALPAGSMLGPALIACLLVAVVLGRQETSRAAAVENALAAARWNDEDSGRPITEVEQAVERLTAAMRDRWDDGDGHLRLAQLWIQLYRLHAFAQFKQELPKADDPQRWRLTDIGQLHARAAELASVKNTGELERMRQVPVVADYLVTAWKHLLWARKACPWLAEVHFELAALCFLAGDPASDQVYMDHVRLLAGNDPNYLYTMGLLDLDDDRTAEAYREFKASWSISLYHHYDILAIVSQRLTMAQILDWVVPASPEILIKMARESDQGPRHAYNRQLILRRIEQLLSTSTMDTADRLHAQAGLELLKSDLPKALADYQRAIQLRPDQTGWRYELSALLQQTQSAAPSHAASSHAQVDVHDGRGVDPLSTGNHP